VEISPRLTEQDRDPDSFPLCSVKDRGNYLLFCISTCRSAETLFHTVTNCKMKDSLLYYVLFEGSTMLSR
jgi:hypothetical protein